MTTVQVERERLKREEALSVLQVLPSEPPGSSIGTLAERALGLNSQPKRRQARKAIDMIIYDFHIRVRRRKGPHGWSTQYWIEPKDEAVRQAVLQEAEQTNE